MKQIEKSTGQIYTPEFIVRNILDLCNYYGKDILKKHIIDNSCGQGAFLCEIVLRYCNEAIKNQTNTKKIKDNLEQYIHGIEIDKNNYKICICNLDNIVEKFGISNVKWDIVCADALQIEKFDNKMDFVVGNPPYVRIHNLNNLNEIKEFKFAKKGMTDLFIVFYEIGIKMLNNSGVLGYITPSSIFNSSAGVEIRSFLASNKLISKVVDLKHFQAFNATTYTAIMILDKKNQNEKIEYYEYDEKKLQPKFVDNIALQDCYLSENLYFSKKEKLKNFKQILSNKKQSDISIKNGYATLCDSVFIFDSPKFDKFIIPVIKASKGIMQYIFYPYNKKGKLISEQELSSDNKIYRYLSEQKERLLKRANEKKSENFWFAFGRSQAINDTYKDKLAINSLIRNKNDIKFTLAPSGYGVYGGLYLTSEKINFDDIQNTLSSNDFINFVELLGKYKSGGYYTFSSKDVKVYLDYKFAN